MGVGNNETYAKNDPACEGKDQKLCDNFSKILNSRGKGCFRIMKVIPIGNDKYTLKCELSSSNQFLVSYTLKYSNNENLFKTHQT